LIKASDVLVKQTDDGDHVIWRGVLSIVVQHREPKSVELTNVDVKAKIDEAVRNSVLRYIYEDLVPIVHDMGKIADPYLPTHLQVQFRSHMDALMDLFLGLEPGPKH
jgi:hypothetical protein